MTIRTVRFSIYRYDPDKDAKPYMQDLTVELQPTDKMLLGCTHAHQVRL